MEDLFGMMVYVLAAMAIVAVAYICVVSSVTLGSVWALGISLFSFVCAIKDNFSAHKRYADKDPNAPIGISRNYFFGPGIYQLKEILNAAFLNQKAHLHKLTAFRVRHTGNAWYWDAVVWIFYCAAYACTFVYGYIWMGGFSFVLLTVLGLGMAGFFAFFGSLTAVDRLMLFLRSISSRCLNCKKTAAIPWFQCSQCGSVHKKLTPGPYGIIKRKCACGEKLPTTFFNGRSKLQALCPHCSIEMVASDAHQFGIQLVGGMNAGKTTFLASFWQHYFKASERVPYLETKRATEEAFDELEYWFNQGLSTATNETNAKMYSVIHRLPDKTPLQFAFYDIAGEAFTRLDNDIQQQQFQYCAGVIFVVDPTAPVAISEDALIGFLDVFRALKGRASTKLATLPVAVIISKADLFRKEIGLVKIKTEHAKNAAAYADAEGNTGLECTRDGVCRRFLHDHGFGNVINLIDGEFKTIEVFPVSAIGHEAAEGKAYNPWGVMQSAFWILKQADEQSKAYFEPVASIVENAKEQIVVGLG